MLAACGADPPSESADLPSTDAQPAGEEAPEPFELPEPIAPPPLSPAQSAAAEAIADAMSDEDPYARAGRLATLLPTLGPEGVPGVKRALQDARFQPTRGGAEIELLVRFWARHEPEAATRWAVGRAPPGYRLSAIFPSLSRWAAVDPTAAAVAAQRWENARGDLRDLVQIALVQGWFEKDPDGLGRYLQQHEMGVARQRKLANYVRLLLHHRGTEATVRWAESVPDDDRVFKQNVYRQTASALTALDLEAALRFCEAHCDGPYDQDLRHLIALSWSRRRDGAGALEWLSRLPDGRERNAALRNAFSTWAQLHPEEAAAWMEARVLGREAQAELEPWLQVLVPTYALILMRQEPSAAITWAERVVDDEERERTLIRVARVWRFEDEAAAEAWLSRSELSEEARGYARQLPPIADRPLPR